MATIATTATEGRGTPQGKGQEGQADGGIAASGPRAVGLRLGDDARPVVFSASCLICDREGEIWRGRDWVVGVLEIQQYRLPTP